MEHIRSSKSGSLLPPFSGGRSFDGLRTPVHASEAAIDKLPNKSSASDSFTVLALKAIADLLAPFVTFLFNRTLQAVHVPFSFNDAFQTPILKKHGLQEDDMSLFRPISNLLVFSTLLDRLIAK